LAGFQLYRKIKKTRAISAIAELVYILQCHIQRNKILHFTKVYSQLVTKANLTLALTLNPTLILTLTLFPVITITPSLILI